MNELRLSIARELAQQAFGGPGHVGRDDVSAPSALSAAEKDMKRILTDRMARSARTIAEPTTNLLYSAGAERQMVTSAKMELVLPSLTSLGKDDRCSMHTLAVRTTKSLQIKPAQEALFGCEVKLGVGIDAGCTAVEFLGQDYKKRVHRGKSNCFECIDQLDIVVQVPVNRPAGAKAIESTADAEEAQFTEGETVVYVPLLGGNGKTAVGLIEIHGLVMEGVTDFAKYRRPESLIRTMIERKDYKFMKYTKLWRRPTDRSGGVLPKKILKRNEKFNHGCYAVVCGRATEANEALNGVPYFGGARFTVVWEDGLCEEAIPPQEFIQLFQNTPASLGCATELTDDLAEQVLILGKKIGKIMEYKRRLETLKKLKKDYGKTGLRPDDICNLACAALIATIRGLKEASFIGVLDPELTDDDTEKKLATHPDTEDKKKPRVLPRLDFDTAEQLVKKAPTGKAVSRSGTMSFAGIATLCAAVDRGYESAPKRVKQKTAGSPPKKDKDTLSKYHREQTIQERSAADRPLGSSSVVISIPDGPIQEWVCSELWLPKEFVFSHSKAKYSSHIFGLVLRTANVTEAAAAEDNGCFQDIMNICSEALVTCWKKDLRKKFRKQLVTELEAKIPELKDLEIPDLIGYVLDSMARAAPGVAMYVGILQKRGFDILYEGCNKLSRMKGNRLLRGRGQGVSFDVIDSQEPLVISLEEAQKNNKLKVGDMVECAYGRRAYRAHIVKCWGHEVYDVRYMEASGGDAELEVAVPLSRITPIAAAFRMKHFGIFGDPFVCVPLSHRDKALGVIGMDRFDLVEKASYDPQPEPGLLEYFRHVGRILGTLIDKRNKKISLASVAKIARNINATFAEIFEVVFNAVQDNLRYCGDMLVSRIVYEDGVNKSEHGAKLLFSRGNPSKIAEMMGYVSTYHPVRSNQKPVQKKGENGQLLWLLCRSRSADKNGQGLIHIISLMQETPISEPDIEYMESLQKLVAAMIQNSVTRKKRSQIRLEALSSIQRMCSQWVYQQIYGNVDYSLHPSRHVSMEALFLDVCDSVSTCYPSANIYIGKLGPQCVHIEYILASKHSQMKGKKLLKYIPKRKGPAVTFSTAEDMRRIYISEGSEDADQLQFFGKKELFEFPFVCVPIAAFEDAVMAVLSVDGCEELATGGGAEGESGSGDSESAQVVEFFYSVATVLSDPIRIHLLNMFRLDLKSIERNAPNFLTGIQQIKEVMLGVLPFATRVGEILLEPVITHKVITAIAPPDSAQSSSPVDPSLKLRVKSGGTKRALLESTSAELLAAAASEASFKKQKTALDEDIVIMFRVLDLFPVGSKGTAINGLYATIVHNGNLISSFDPGKPFDMAEDNKVHIDEVMKQSLNTLNGMFKVDQKNRSGAAGGKFKQSFNISTKNGLCKIVIAAGTELNKVKIELVVHGRRNVPGEKVQAKYRAEGGDLDELGENADECGRIVLPVSYFCNTQSVIIDHMVPVTGAGTKLKVDGSVMKKGYADIYSAKVSMISKVWSKDEMVAYQLTKILATGLIEVGPTGAPIEPFVLLKYQGRVIAQSDPVRASKLKKDIDGKVNREGVSPRPDLDGPEWDIKSDKTRLIIPQSLANDASLMVLSVEVYDSDILLGRGVFLGSTLFSTAEIVDICSTDKRIFLAPLPGSAVSKPPVDNKATSSLSKHSNVGAATASSPMIKVDKGVQFQLPFAPTRRPVDSTRPTSRGGARTTALLEDGWHELIEPSKLMNAEADQQSYVQGYISIYGYSYNLDDGALYHEIDLIYKALCNSISTVNEDVKSAKNKAKSTKNAAKTQACELQIVRAKNLIVVNSADVSGALGRTMGVENPFAVVYFNGIEIGKTATVREFISDPSWEEEFFTVYLPIGTGPDAMSGVLLIELHEINSLGRSQKVGSVTILSKALVSLLAGKEMKKQWFDVDAALPAVIAAGEEGATQSLPSYKYGVVSGALLLTGRPMDVEATGKEPPPVDPIDIEFGLMAISGLPIQDKGAKSISIGERLYFTLDWNGRRVYDSSYSEVLQQYVQQEVFGCTLFGGTKRAFSSGDRSHHHASIDESVEISLPHIKPLNKCMLLIQIWNEKSFKNQSSSSPFAYGVVDKENLVDIVHSRGEYCSEFWVNLVQTTLAYQTDSVTTGSIVANDFYPGKLQCKLRGGVRYAPDAPRHLSEDAILHNRLNNLGGEEYIFELLAGTNIPKLRSVFANTKSKSVSTTPDISPNIYAVLFFNDIEVGVSNTCRRTTDPVWENQKFMLQFPMIDPLFLSLHAPGSDSINHLYDVKNKLKIELWHKEEFLNHYINSPRGQTMDQYLGYFILDGDELASFVNNEIDSMRQPYSIQWFDIDVNSSPPVSSTSDNNSASVHAAMYPRDRIIPGFKPAMIKIRMGRRYAELSSTKKLQSEVGPALSLEYMVEVLFARELANTDPFGKSNPFVIVYLNGEEIGRTRVEADTLNPIWTPDMPPRRLLGGVKRDSRPAIAMETNLGSKNRKLSESSIKRPEKFMILLPPDVSIDECILTLEVYDWKLSDIIGGSSSGSSGELLGEVRLTRTDLINLVATSVSSHSEDKLKEFTVAAQQVLCEDVVEEALPFFKRGGEVVVFELQPNEKLSEGENQFVQGFLGVRGYPIITPAVLSDSMGYEYAGIKINSASRLPKLNLLGKLDPFCVVYWRCKRLNAGVEKVVGTTRTIRNTHAPSWKDKPFKILVPREEWSERKQKKRVQGKSLTAVSGDTDDRDEIADDVLDDWSSVEVRIEVWDSQQDGQAKGTFLGAVALSGRPLRDLVRRKTVDCLDVLIFSMGTTVALPKIRQKQVQGDLMLSGGTLPALNRWLAASADVVGKARFLLDTEGHDGMMSDESDSDIGEIKADDEDVLAEVQENIDGAQQLDEFGNPAKISDETAERAETFDTPFTLQLIMKEAVGLPKAPIFGVLETYATIKWKPKIKVTHSAGDDENASEIEESLLITQSLKGGDHLIWDDIPKNVFYLRGQYEETLSCILEEYDDDEDEDGLIAEEMQERKLKRQLSGCSLEITLYNKPLFGEVVSLGTAIVTTDHLIEMSYLAKPIWVDVRGPTVDLNPGASFRDTAATKKVCIMGRVEEAERNRDTSQRVSMRLASESIPFNPNIAGIKKRVLSLIILAVSDLPASKSSLAARLPAVCVTVVYNGTRIGKTGVAAKSLDPRWDELRNNDFMSIVVPFVYPEIGTQRDDSLVASDGARGVVARQGMHFPLDPLLIKAIGRRPSSVKRGVLLSDVLVVQVWDTSQGNKLEQGSEGLLLGSVELKGNDLADFIALNLGGSKRETHVLYDALKSTAVSTKKSIFSRKLPAQPVDERRSVGKVELILMDNYDSLNDVDAGRVIHANPVRIRGLHQEFPMVSVKQHRPVNRETDLIIKVPSARNLLLQTNGKANRNPYYIVWLNDRLIGRSAVARDTPTPKWRSEVEFFVLPFEQLKSRERTESDQPRRRTSSMSGQFTAKYSDHKLRIELWDQFSSGQKAFLGGIVIFGDMYDIFDPYNAHRAVAAAAGIEASNVTAPEKWFSLVRSDIIPSHLQSCVGGELSVSLAPPENKALNDDDKEEDIVPEGVPIAFEITICSAENLSRADTFGLSDPFCIVKFDGAEVGRTGVRHKTTNPVWSGERFVVSMLLPESSLTNGAGIELPSDASLQVEVWDMDSVGVGDFLGCVRLTGRALSTFFGTTALARAGKKNNNPKPTTFSLHKISSMSEEKQKLVKGKLTMIAKDISKRINRRQRTADGKGFVIDDEEEDVSMSYLDAVTLSAGEPHMTVQILSCTNLASGLTSRPPEAMCRVIWDGALIGSTDALPQTADPVWSVDSPMDKTGKSDGSGCFFRIHLSRRAEATSSATLILEAYDVGNILSEIFLGSVNLSFWSLLRLHGGGVVTLPLKPKDYTSLNVPSATVIGNSQTGMFAKFTENIKAGFKELGGAVHEAVAEEWEASIPRNPTSFTRRIVVASARNLPEVNNLLPSCKVVILYDGAIIGKSMVMPSSSFPVWPETACDIIVGFDSTASVVIQVFHVDVDNRRDICLGEATISAEILLRPPAEEWEAHLMPPERLPPKKYRFILDGSVKVSVSMEAFEGAAKLIPWAAKFIAPQYSYDTKDVCKYSHASAVARGAASLRPSGDTPALQSVIMDRRLRGMENKSYASSKLTQFFPVPPPPLPSDQQERLTEDELRWLGSLSGYSVPQVVGGRPEWIVVPVRDAGAVVADRIIGTPPGIQYALCIKRPLDRLKNSDVMRIMELHSAIEQSVCYLRKRDIFRELRHRASLKLKDTLENMSKRADLDLQLMFKKLATTLMQCVPGAQIYTAVLNVDFNSITYSLFDALSGGLIGHSENGEVKTATLWLGQGSDWASVGRKAVMTSIKTLDDVQKIGCKFACFKPFNHCSFPRYTVPLQSGDVSLGLFGVENLDIYQGGISKKDFEIISPNSGKVGEESKATSENLSFLELLSNPFGVSREIKELNDWLQATAGMCGEVMYAARERHAINELELYNQLSSSTPTGLMRRMLNSCLSVLQGCRMIELWAVRRIVRTDRPPITKFRSPEAKTALPTPAQKKSLKDSDDSDTNSEHENDIHAPKELIVVEHAEKLPRYKPDVDSPAEYDITSLAVQTPRPPPEPGRRLNFVDIKLIFDPMKKMERKKIFADEQKKPESADVEETEVKLRKSSVFAAALGKFGDGSEGKEAVSVFAEEEDEEPEPYTSVNATQTKLPTKFMLGICYNDIEQCCLLNCAADLPEKVENAIAVDTIVAAKPSRKVLSRSEMLSTKNGTFVPEKESKVVKKNAYIILSSQPKKPDYAEARHKVEQRRKEYKRQQERQKLLKHTYLGEDTNIVLGSDRDFKLVVYEVTNDMKIINEFQGVVQLVTFKETAFKCKLVPSREIADDNAPTGFFMLTMDIQWQLRSHLDGGHSGAVGSDMMWKNKACTLNITSGGGLKKTDVMGSADPFCEIFLNGNFIAKTSVQSDTLNPVWEEEITLPPFESIKDVCTIEVYDMNRLGKGNFMGQLELTMDQLLYPPVRDIRIPLSMKSTLPTKKQLYVGGYLSLRYSISAYKNTVTIKEADKKGLQMTKKTTNFDTNDEGRSATPNNHSRKLPLQNQGEKPITATKPKNKLNSVPLWIASMKSPRLRISVCRATALPKTSSFLNTLPSAYVKIFLVDERAVTAKIVPPKTKGGKGDVLRHSGAPSIAVNQTTIRTNSTEPVWNETYELNIESHLSTFSSLAHMEKTKLLLESSTGNSTDSAKTIQFADFMTIKLEVWDSSEEFLGMILLPASEYMAYVCSDAVSSANESEKYETSYSASDLRTLAEVTITKYLHTASYVDKKKSKLINGNSLLTVQVELFDDFKTSMISGSSTVAIDHTGPEGVASDFDDIEQSMAAEPDYFVGVQTSTQKTPKFAFNLLGGLLWTWKVEIVILKAQDLVLVNEKARKAGEEQRPSSKNKKRGFSLGWKNSSKWGKPDMKSDPYCVLHWVTSRYVPETVDASLDPKNAFAQKYAAKNAHPDDKVQRIRLSKLKFKKVIVSDKILGQTACKRNTVNPYWSGERFLLDMSHLLFDMDLGSIKGPTADVLHELVIEVWSLPPATSPTMFAAGSSRPPYEENVSLLLQHGDVGVFLGEIRIDLCNLLHPENEIKTERLKSKIETETLVTGSVSEKTRSSSYKKDRDAAMANEYVGGKLSYKMHKICQPFYAALPRKHHLYGVDATNFGTAASNPLEEATKDSQVATASDIFKKHEFKSNFSVDTLHLEVVMDPEAEEERQAYQGLKLPGLLKSIRDKHENYLSNPFRRIGLISELHYGQLSSAVDRSQSTVLKSPKLDMHVIPTINVSSDTIKFDKDTDGDHARQGYRSNSSHYSLKLPAKSSKMPPNMSITLSEKQTDNFNDDKFVKDTMLCLVSRYEPDKLPRRDVQFLQAARQVIVRGINMMESRAARLRKRYSLLENLRGLLVPGRQRFEMEEIILQVMQMIESSIELGVTVYVVKPVHRQLNHIRGAGMKRQAGNKTMMFDRSLFRCSNVNGELSSQTIAEELMADEKSGDRNTLLLTTVAPLCRHGYLLQAYRGYHSLAGYDWTAYGDIKSDEDDDPSSSQEVDQEYKSSLEHTTGVKAGVANIEACARGDRSRALSQTCLVPLLDASHVLDALEPLESIFTDADKQDMPRLTSVDSGEEDDGDQPMPLASKPPSASTGLCELISQVAKKECVMGNYVVPLIAYDSMCVGMIVLSGADKIPHSIYETLVLKPGRKLIENDKMGNTNHNAAAADKWDKVYREEPEEGVASSLVAAGKLIGALIAQAAVDMAIKEMKTFVIREETPLLDVLRFCFRCIANAFPVITGLSIWGVDCVKGRSRGQTKLLSVDATDNKEMNYKNTKFQGKNDKTNESQPAVKSESAKANKPEADEDAACAISDESDASLAEEGPDEQAGDLKSTRRSKVLLNAGYFGLQDVIDLVAAAPDERLIDRLGGAVAPAAPQRSSKKGLIGVVSEKEKERLRLRRSMAHIASVTGDDRFAVIKGDAADKIYKNKCQWKIGPVDFITLPKYGGFVGTGQSIASDINESFQRLLRNEILKCLYDQGQSCFRVSSGHDLIQIAVKATVSKKGSQSPLTEPKNTIPELKIDDEINNSNLNGGDIESMEDKKATVADSLTTADKKVLYTVLDDLFGIPKASRLTPRTKKRIKREAEELAAAAKKEEQKKLIEDSAEELTAVDAMSGLDPKEPSVPSKGIGGAKPPPAPPVKKFNASGTSITRARSTNRRNKVKPPKDGTLVTSGPENFKGDTAVSSALMDKAEESEDNRRHNYFLAISTIGFGGKKGWGSLGDISGSSGELMRQMVCRLELTVLKWATIQSKKTII